LPKASCQSDWSIQTEPGSHQKHLGWQRSSVRRVPCPPMHCWRCALSSGWRTRRSLVLTRIIR